MIFTEALTMEEIFIVSYLGGITLGVLLGLLFYWIFEKENSSQK